MILTWGLELKQVCCKGQLPQVSILYFKDGFKKQAHREVWIWWGGGAFWKKVDFCTCFLGESGPSCEHFERKSTFLRSHCRSGACSPGNIWKINWKSCICRHYDVIIFDLKLWLTKHVQNCGPFWTLWENGFFQLCILFKTQNDINFKLWSLYQNISYNDNSLCHQPWK